MSRAEELLDSLTEEQIMMYGVNPVDEPHIVIESDKSITIPDDLRHIAVQGEHNIETVTFDCPRYWDGHDLSQMQMRIVYQRPDGHREPHLVENLRVDEVDENTIHFEWTISGNVTAVKGDISFMVCAKLSDSEGNREREWHTRLNQDLVVDEGMECSGEEIVEQNPDIIEAILVQLDDLKNTGGVSDEQIANAVAAYLEEHPIESGVDEQQVRDIVAVYLEENPPEGGTITEEQIATAVANYMSQYPVEGESGGHYIPVVTQPTDNTMQVSFMPSKVDMPAVDPVTVNLPVGEGSGQNPYELPVGGDELGGVKNGGNVVINADGTMTAPENKPTDEQVGGAVSNWMAEHPDATTTVADHSLDPNKNTWMHKVGPVNLYNPAETVSKTEVTDKGAEVESGYLSCTGYIPVTPGVYVATGAPWYYAIYKADKSFIKRFGASSSSVFDLSAQPEAAYLRLMYYGVPDASTFMVSRDALPDAFIAYDDPNNTRTDITDETVARGVGRAAEQYFRENGINDAIPEHSLPVDKLPPFVPYLPNLFDFSKMEPGAVGSNGGDLGYEGNYRSPYIPVVGGETYYLYTPGAMGTNYASWVYDADKNPVWRIPEGANPITVPADVGAAYMRIGSVSEGTVVSVGTPSRVSIPFVPSLRFVDDAVRVDVRAYLMGTYGVRVFCIGDSITAGYSESGRVTTPWPMILNRDWRYNATNYGITGTTLSTTKTNNMSDRLKSYDPAECDICLVMGGFNDGGEGVELGAIDSTDTATVYGALNDICNTLVTRYSGKRYALITTPKYYATTEKWNIDTAILEVGAKWGVPVIDLHKRMMPLCLNDEIKAIYCADGVHPLDPGQEILGRIIGGELLRL